MIEIYNEQVRDLLTKDFPKGGRHSDGAVIGTSYDGFSQASSCVSIRHRAISIRKAFASSQ